LIQTFLNLWDAYTVYNAKAWDNFDFAIAAGSGLTRIAMFVDKVAWLGWIDR